MTESTPPPSPSPASPKLWWLIWILCTVIPSSFFPLSAVLSGGLEWLGGIAGIGCLVFQLIASFKLGEGRSGWLTAGLILGGWALILVSVFIGCITTLIKMNL